jgi:hypothetical protein
VQRGLAIRQVQRQAATPRFPIDCAFPPNERGDVGDRIVNPVAAIRSFGEEGLIEVLASRRVDREERQVTVVGPLRPLGRGLVGASGPRLRFHFSRKTPRNLEFGPNLFQTWTQVFRGHGDVKPRQWTELPLVAVSPRTPRDEQLRDLDGVQRGALPEVVGG